MKLFQLTVFAVLVSFAMRTTSFVLSFDNSAQISISVPLTQPFLRTATPGVHILADGNYGGGFRLNRGGTAANPLVLRAEHPGKCIIIGGIEGMRLQGSSYVVLDGLTFTGAHIGLRATDGANVKIMNCHFFANATTGILAGSLVDSEISDCQSDHNVAEHGIYLGAGCAGVKLLHNTCTDNGKSGIQVNGAGPQGPNHDIVIDGNTITHNGITMQAAAINLLTVWNIRVSNNVLVNNLANGIAVSYSPALVASGKSIPAVSFLGNKVTDCGWRDVTGGGTMSYSGNAFGVAGVRAVIDPSSPKAGFIDGGGNTVATDVVAVQLGARK